MLSAWRDPLYPHQRLLFYFPTENARLPLPRWSRTSSKSNYPTSILPILTLLAARQPSPLLNKRTSIDWKPPLPQHLLRALRQGPFKLVLPLFQKPTLVTWECSTAAKDIAAATAAKSIEKEEKPSDCLKSLTRFDAPTFHLIKSDWRQKSSRSWSSHTSILSR